MPKFGNMFLMIGYLKTGCKFNLKELAEKLKISDKDYEIMNLKKMNIKF